MRLRRLTGREASGADWDFFTACYRRTYREHRSTPYLTRGVLRHDRRAHARPGAARDRRARRRARSPPRSTSSGRGRSTGATGAASSTCPGLHFEACYYQAIEFCIERGIALFEGGAQGEHKHARGFLPEATRSFHWLAHPAFNRAVDEFLGREGAGIAAYLDELNERTPFRK